MPVIHSTVPQITIDAIVQEAESRTPPISGSRVVAEVLVPAFADRAAAITAERAKKQRGNRTNPEKKK